MAYSIKFEQPEYNSNRYIRFSSITGSIDFQFDRPQDVPSFSIGQAFKLENHIPNIVAVASVVRIRHRHSIYERITVVEIDFVCNGKCHFIDSKQVQDAVDYHYPNQNLKPEPTVVNPIYLKRKIELE